MIPLDPADPATFRILEEIFTKIREVENKHLQELNGLPADLSEPEPKNSKSSSKNLKSFFGGFFRRVSRSVRRRKSTGDEPSTSESSGENKSNYVDASTSTDEVSEISSTLTDLKDAKNSSETKVCKPSRIPILVTRFEKRSKLNRCSLKATSEIDLSKVVYRKKHVAK